MSTSKPPKKTPAKKAPAKKVQGRTRAVSTKPELTLPADVGAYDRAYGERAFEAFRDRIDAVTDQQLVSLRTDVARAGARALALAAAVLEPAAYARLQALPASELDMSHVDDLAPLSSAAMYIHEQAVVAGAFSAEAEIPPELAQGSAEVEERMQELLEQHLSNDPEIGPLLLALAPGHSYRDRASDLLGYARIYEMRPDALRAGQENYRATDVEQARRYALEILAVLRATEGPAARLWGDRMFKVFTLLQAAHTEARATWLWLERRDPTTAERFPSLYFTPRRTPSA